MTAPDPQPDASKLFYVGAAQLDPCELPDLVIEDEGAVKFATGQWTCKHGTTWTAVPVGIRGGIPQMAWIIRPPGPPPDEPTP